MVRLRSLASRTALTFALALSALVAAPSFADAQTPTKKKANAGRTLSFEEDSIETSYLRPEGSSIQGINKKKRQSLIRVRLDFFAEIVRSAQDL